MSSECVLYACRLQRRLPAHPNIVRVVDAFETAYLGALLKRHEGNITRSAQEAGLTRYHLRELLKRHGLSPQR